jgi:hypothetical protein
LNGCPPASPPLHAEPAASLKSSGFFVTLLEGG